MDKMSSDRSGYREKSGKRQSAGTEFKAKSSETTQHLREQTIQRGRDFMSQRKSSAAEVLADFAEVLEGAADQLGGRNHGLSADLMRTASDGARQFSRSLQEQDIDGIVHQVQSFSRRQPLLVMGGALLTGFAFTRLLRATTEESSTSHEAEHHETRTPDLGPETAQKSFSDREPTPEYAASTTEPAAAHRGSQVKTSPT